MNAAIRAMMMPIWEDCPWADLLPPGVIVKRDGNLGVIMFGAQRVGINIEAFNERNLPEIFRRLGVSEPVARTP